MSAVTAINVALHALLLSALGWCLVRWCVADARHRAWASLLVLLAAMIAPWIMELPNEPAGNAADEFTAAPATSWKPDWKLPAPVRQTASPPPSVAETVIAPAWSIADFAWWACAVWFAGGILLGMRHAGMSIIAWRWRRSLRSLSAEEAGLVPCAQSRATLRVFENDGCPCVAGVWKPVIAVPERIIREWSPRHWTWLLRHEGEHVRGGDTLIAWLLGWVKTLLWWNPFAHGLVEQWAQAREEICDRAAVASDGDPAAYSSFLLDIAASTRPSAPALLHMAASKPARRLRARMVAMLAWHRVRERVSPLFLLGALGIMAAGSVLVSCVGLKDDALPPVEESTKLLTRTFKVPPDFLSDGKPPTDPFSDESKGRTAPGKKTAKDFLAGRGIPFPEGAAAVYNPATSQLVVRNTTANMDRIDLELESLRGERETGGTQVYVTTKWVELDAAPGLEIPSTPGPKAELRLDDGSLLTDPQFQAVIRALSQTKGADLMSAPSITTKLGQRASVEVINEIPSKNINKESQEPAADFTGVRTDLLVQFAGDRLKLVVHGDLGEFASVEEGGGRRPGDAKVVHLRRNRTVSIGDGETLLLKMGRSPSRPSREVLLFVTPKLIDPTGPSVGGEDAVQRARRLEALRKTAPKPVTGSKPVTIEVKIVDLRHGKDGDWLKIFSGAIPQAPGAAGAEKEIPPTWSTKLQPAHQAPGSYSLSGVFTPAQFDTMLRTFTKRDDVKITSFPALKTTSGQVVTVASRGREQRDFSITLNPAVGADGSTIDLSIAIKDNAKGTRTGPITTAVTIWDGQSVVLGGLASADENGKVSRAIFITATLDK